MFTAYRRLPSAARLLLEIALMTALFFAIQAWMGREMSRGPLPAVQAGQTVQGESLNLPLKGETPYLVHFWATWCPVCKFMESSVESISGDYPVIGIALQSGTTTEIQTFMEEHGISYPVISDPDGAVSRRFGVSAVPGTFVVDADNRIRFSERGLSSEWGLRLRLWWSGFSGAS